MVALVSLGVLVTPAEAYDNPELLPDHPTPVIDLAKVFSDTQRAQLEASLADVEERTGCASFSSPPLTTGIWPGTGKANCRAGTTSPPFPSRNPGTGPGWAET